jgi:hypothetical protein
MLDGVDDATLDQLLRDDAQSSPADNRSNKNGALLQIRANVRNVVGKGDGIFLAVSQNLRGSATADNCNLGIGDLADYRRPDTSKKVKQPFDVRRMLEVTYKYKTVGHLFQTRGALEEFEVHAAL